MVVKRPGNFKPSILSWYDQKEEETPEVEKKEEEP